ncbi:hypothetical protein C8F01DRAFT_1372596 [Mycena amicta]|nr:hypothetical protein C8F01DRAFT_1372596 [Mycena amicta]
MPCPLITSLSCTSDSLGSAALIVDIKKSLHADATKLNASETVWIFPISPAVELPLLVEKLEKCDREKELPKLKITVENAVLYIRRRMGAAEHERAAQLASLMQGRVAGLADLDPAEPNTQLSSDGATTWTWVNSCKQADGCLLPATREMLPNPWPTVVVEVAYSDSAPALYRDVDQWMTMSGTAQPLGVKLVIAINLRKGTQTLPAGMDVEFFERAPHQLQLPNGDIRPRHATLVANLGPYHWNTNTHMGAVRAAFPAINIPLTFIYDQIPP